MNETLLHLLPNRVSQSPNYAAVHFKENGGWRTYTWAQLYRLVAQFSLGLTKAGIEKETRVALLSETRPEWMISDLAIMGSRGVVVPIYPSQRAEEIEYILNHAEVKFLIVENLEQLEKWKLIADRCPSVSQVFVIDSVDNIQNFPKTMRWKSCLESDDDCIEKFESQSLSLTEQDWATLLYTSGTTGQPKGVVLTHRQIISEVKSVFSFVSVSPKDTTLTFLPFSHVLGRVESWGAVACGYSLGFAESIERIKQNLQEIKPTFIIAVPRVFEKLYSAILTQAQNNPIKKRLFEWALAAGRKYSRAQQTGEGLDPASAAEYALAKKLVFDKIIDGLGGRLRLAASGGAPLNADIIEFFHAVGILILEGYGLTETTAAITFNSPLHYKFGTVGRALPGVELKLAADGEILVRSPMNLKEYYRDSKAQDSAFDGDFFKTGDIGQIDSDGFLTLTDRKKDLIKTAGGKYVAPQRLEGLLKRSPYISNVLIHGDQRKYIVSLITLNESAVTAWAKKNGVEHSDFKELTKSPEVQALVRDAVAEANLELASFESIKKFAVLDRDFSIEKGEITPSLKVKRKVVDRLHSKLIDELYGD